ncbi:FLYWCH zinc finger domain-containing protein [Phthorimaea operculella]|nr:FLYWCH zinc finger domain-containing protein [Phthorimaea operculella]
MHKTDSISAAHFITLSNGKTLLMINGFTFHKTAASKYCGGFRWRCSNRLQQHCNAFVVLGADDVIVRSSACFVKTVQGAQLLRYANYTFSRKGGIRQGGSRYCCSKFAQLKCPAFIHLSKENVILPTSKLGPHNHPPPTFHYTKTGELLLIK